ncbi:MAG: bifunctional enoyl-CoA hydratase/phosphate acetyltransferase [Pelotomaculum sp. PtaB.Bin104]|nr:MAG: bifunctional enoyl-CoA hydratase/phosphate acetyltransferase [Pelotomaculum sp. PtaB.Bin104]
MVQDHSFEEIEVGDCASISKTISEADIFAYAGITGDLNPNLLLGTYKYAK